MAKMDLDKICQMTKSAEMLNTLHACRNGHPLGRDNPFKWRNAWSMAITHRGISMTACEWLKDQATKAGEFKHGNTRTA